MRQTDNIVCAVFTDCDSYLHCIDWSTMRSCSYYNTPMLYTANFNGCKNDNFQLNVSIFFLIFAQNINCGYTQL